MRQVRLVWRVERLANDVLLDLALHICYRRHGDLSNPSDKWNSLELHLQMHPQFFKVASTRTQHEHTHEDTSLLDTLRTYRADELILGAGHHDLVYEVDIQERHSGLNTPSARALVCPRAVKLVKCQHLPKDARHTCANGDSMHQLVAVGHQSNQSTCDRILSRVGQLELSKQQHLFFIGVPTGHQKRTVSFGLPPSNV